MNKSSFIVEGKVNDWRMQMELCALVSEFLKIRSRDDFMEQYYHHTEEADAPLYAAIVRSMDKFRRFSPDKEFYPDLEYGYDASRELILQGFRIGYSTQADEDEFNRDLKKKGERPMGMNWPTHTLCTVIIPELASRGIVY